jgi:hypothetical protein
MEKRCTEFCYLCEMSLSEGEESIEHVIPRGLFGQKKGLIEVPAHKACNNAFSQDDEYFRLCMTSAAVPHDPIAKKIWDGPVMRGFHRPEMPGLKKATLNALRPVDVHSPAGIYLGTKDAFFQDAKRLHSVVNRITRGLYAYRTGKILPLDWPVESEMRRPDDLASEQVRLALEPLRIFLRPVSNGAFRYDWKYLEEDSRESFFWMSFYQTVPFWSFTGTKLRDLLSPRR